MSRRSVASPRLPGSSKPGSQDMGRTPSYSRPFSGYPEPHGKRNLRLLAHLRRPLILAPTLALVLLAAVTLTRGNGPKESYSSALGNGFLERIKQSTRPSALSHAANLHGEFSCDPFLEDGRLHVDTANPTNNIWRPYDSACQPSKYMNYLYRPAGDVDPLIPHAADSVSRRQQLPWFANRTIIIHGDSIDRYHLKDFCEFVQGNLFNIGPDHPASPPPYHRPHTPIIGQDGLETAESAERDRLRREKEAFWEGRPIEGIQLTNPWVCDVAEYGTTLVSVFTWGLQGAEEFFETERWYNPPATWVDRLSAITKPLLPRLAAFMNRPQIEYPDLIELNSGFWDLRKYTEEDFVAAGFTSRPYPEDSPIPYTNLSPKREQIWETEARKAIKSVAYEFRGRDGRARSGPAIVWRTLHHPPRHNYAPFPRVFALDSLARKVIKDLKREGKANAHHIAAQFGSHRDEIIEDLGLDERLRIDNSGGLMLGQEHHFRDLLHPHAIPGSYLWADVILYELKRAVEKVGRS